MLSDKPRLFPLIGIGALLVLALALWQQVIPGTPDWLATVSYMSIFMIFVVWCIALLDFIVKSIAFGYSLYTIARPDIRLVEALSRMDTNQLTYLGWLWGTTAEDGEIGTTDNLIPLPTGESVPAIVLSRMVADVTEDGELPPERSYIVGQQSARQGYSAMARAGIINKGTNNSRPTIKNRAMFNKIVETMKGK